MSALPRFLMTFRQAVCIYNPTSGRGISQARLDGVRQALSRSADDVRLAPTVRPGHATVLARQAVMEGCDLVAVYSGDGTVNEVVQGLAGRVSPALLALPGGTGNVLVNELGLPLDPLKAAQLLPRLATRPVRLGRAVFGRTRSSRYFLLMCGAGLDAAIADRVSAPLKRRLGQAAFWVSAASFSLQRFPRVRLAATARDTVGPPCSLVVISKSRLYGGGLVLAPGAHLLRNQFVAAQYTGANRIAFSCYLTAAVCRLISQCPGVRLVVRSDMVIEPVNGESGQVQVDGEVVGELPVHVTLCDTTCPVLMPRSYIARGSDTSHS